MILKSDTFGTITRVGDSVVRDARVAMLYEGANGVQALDLAGRKLLRDGGVVAERFLALVEGECEEAPDELHDLAAPLREAMHGGLGRLWFAPSDLQQYARAARAITRTSPT